MPLRHWSRKALALLPLIVGDAFAQGITNATCGTQYHWMNNALGQSPCLVAAYLSDVCAAGSWTIPALPSAGDSYSAPDGDLVCPCQCSTVVYNLMQACADCQGGVTRQWQYWIQYCPEAYISQTFPYSIPNGTQVPTWADLDPSAVGVWSPTVASAYAVGPSASITPGLTSPSPSSPSTPVGAIAGGVVGGAALFIAVGFGIGFLCFRVRRQPRQMQEDMTSSNVGGMYSGALPGQMYSGALPGQMYSGALPGQMYSGALPGHMSANTPGSQVTTAPLQQPQPPYSPYPPSLTINQSLPSSDHDVPHLDAESTRQNFYPQHLAPQSFGQFSSASPQASPPLEPSTSTPPGVQRILSPAPSYRTSQIT
ncbi:hypothetical protein M407DRAFT_28136 [Tulasnella calospora MUT 4182]|uniref:Transmembrane protein n=1 Tax=Tulasnella calospora MUT 4182 TaxID=1051891 RepID=A0A0C3QBB2_9AGAM|nr:hypothetical protein M407DRAFT_28136 [Tulasnella calospora MUT 4182]